MAHYRRSGDVPPKRHTQHRRPDGGLYYEELMGEEGFSSDSSLLYHRGIPSAMVDAAPWELPATSRHRRNHRCCPAPEAARALRRGVEGRRPGDRSAAGAGQRRRADLLRGGRGGQPAVPQRDGRRVRVRRVRQRRRWRPCSVRWTLARATTCCCPARPRTAGCRPGDEPLRLYAIEANSHIAPPKRYLSRYGQLLEHAPYCERDLHGPGEPLLVEETDVEVLVKHRGTGRDHRHPARAAHAPVRRGRLGRLPLPLHVQRRRLRADHRPGAPAAAGAPGVRGQQLRDLQLRAAQGGLPPAGRCRCPTTTPTWTPTR